MLRWLLNRIPSWGGHITFWDGVFRILGGLGLLAVGWWTAARAYTEGVIASWGTLGYVGVILAVALALALVFLATSVGVYLFRMRRAGAAPSIPGQALAVPETAEHPAEPEQAVDVDEEARHELTLFVTDYVIPACEAQRNLQEMIIKHSYVNDALARLAIQSIMRSNNLRDFGERYEYLLISLCSSPMSYIPFTKLKEHILFMDKNYIRLCAQANELAAGAGFECHTHNAFAPLWEEWRQSHNSLVDAYRSIKRDRRFAPELYRPGINGPWTTPIPPSSPA